MSARRKNGGGRANKEQPNRPVAPNLFAGIAFDVTSEPIRTLQFQAVGRSRYLMSAFDKGGRKQNRMNYDKLESAVLDYFFRVKWHEVAASGESDEVRSIRAELDVTLRELDKVTRRVEVNTTAMDAEGIDSAALTVLATKLAKDQSAITTLTANKERLQTALSAAIGKSAALHDSESFLNLIRSAESGNLRLRLRTEIQRRISRIALVFGNEDYPTIFVQIEYSKGGQTLRGTRNGRQVATSA
jgi:hypothetical protein